MRRGENRMRRGLVHSLTCTAIVQLTRVVCVSCHGAKSGVFVHVCLGVSAPIHFYSSVPLLLKGLLIFLLLRSIQGTLSKMFILLHSQCHYTGMWSLYILSLKNYD